MIEIIGEIRDATPEELERFRNIQKELSASRDTKGQEECIITSGEDKVFK